MRHGIQIVMIGLALMLAVGCGSDDESTSNEAPRDVEADMGAQVRVTEPIPLGDAEGTITGMAPMDGAVWVGGVDSRGAGSIWHVDGSGDVGAIRLPDVQDVAAGAGAVWVVGSATSDAPGPPTLFRIDPETEEVVTRIPLGQREGSSRAAVQRVAVGGDGSVWVAVSHGRDAGEILRIDPDTNEVAARIDAQGVPGDVIPGDGAVWFLSDPRPGTGGVSLHRIDPDSNEVVATPLRESLHDVGGSEILPSIAVGADSVWVSSIEHGRQEVVRIDTATNETTTEPITLRHVSPVAVTNEGVWFIGRGGLSRLDSETLEVDGPVDLNIAPVDVRRDAPGNTLWAAGHDAQLVSVDLR